jgi:Zn-dependent protease
MIDQIYWILFSIPSILIASTVHEYAHAYTAYLLGDATAKMNGRMTLNPLAHIDPVGAIMMVLVRFGWSKPVPINEYNFENPVIGTAITSLAGPASNLLLAIITAIPLRIMLASTPLNSGSLDLGFVSLLLLTFIVVNISLAVFNLLPIPPLDGHKIVRAFLPENLRHHWERMQVYGMWILILLFFPISPLYKYTVGLLSFLMDSALSILVGL